MADEDKPAQPTKTAPGAQGAQLGPPKQPASTDEPTDKPTEDSTADPDRALQAELKLISALRSQVWWPQWWRTVTGLVLIVLGIAGSVGCAWWSYWWFEAAWAWMIANPATNVHPHFPSLLLAKGFVALSVFSASGAAIRHGTTLQKPLWPDLKRNVSDNGEEKDPASEKLVQGQLLALLAGLAAIVKKGGGPS